MLLNNNLKEMEILLSMYFVLQQVINYNDKLSII